MARRAAQPGGRSLRALALFKAPDLTIFSGRLLAQIRTLAGRVRIPLDPSAAGSGPSAPAEVPAPYGLTGRELAVLRLVAAGRTNAQVGAELYISPKTVGVHVSNILRKLGVSGRAHASALAERAGLLRSYQS